MQRVLGTDPDHIEEQAVRLARIGARPPPQHLLVQGQALGRAGHDDAIDGGFVKAFGEHGTVRHHPRGAGVQALEDGAAGRQRGGGVQGLRRDPGRAERGCHGIRRRHRGGKEQRLAVGGVGLKGGEHLGWGVGGQQQRLQVGLDKIAALGAQRIEVGLEQHLDGPQVDEIPGLHHLHQAALVHDPVKDLLEGLAIAPRGRRGHPHHERPVGLPGATMGEDATIGRGGGMVRFVNDDGAKIRDQAGEPGPATQGLHTGHHDRGRVLIPRRLHHAQGQRRIDEVQFVEGLLDQLVAVRQDQGAAARGAARAGRR